MSNTQRAVVFLGISILMASAVLLTVTDPAYAPEVAKCYNKVD